MNLRCLAVVGLGLAAASAAPAFQQRGGASIDRPTQRFYVTTPHVPLEASAHVATEVVHARVESVRAHFPERGVATTIYTVRVLWALKGETASILDVSVAGARDESHWVEVVGAPHFAIGEELVLFLWKAPEGGETGILGLERGTYRVAREASGRTSVTGDHAAQVELGEFIDTVAEAWLRAELSTEATEGR
jgi:hypothetical protein